MAERVLYRPAPEVAELAVPLIAEYHPELASAPIVYVFRTPAAKTHDRTVLGRALRIMGLKAFLVALAAGELDTETEDPDHSFYVMEIARPQWVDATPEARRALVDHELCHFHPDPETGELKIRAHDVEEFISVAYRHGAWSPDLETLLAVCATPA